jgi:arylsulfatase A-like enzyme
MKILQRSCAVLLVCLVFAGLAPASAYDAQPKLVVVIIIDQFRGDYLERVHSQLGQGGFRLFTDKGANFVNCYYNYASTETAPGHATLFTGAYSNGHGVFANQVYDEKGDRWIGAVGDDSVRVVGLPGVTPSASPRVLLTDTLGDELKMATGNRSHVYSISLKDRAAVLPGGFAADGAFWIDQLSGTWITSTFYMKELPKWAQEYNANGRAAGYWDKDWKDANGKVLQHTTHQSSSRFYDVIGGTGFGNEYELDFARDLVTNTNLGNGPTTDFLFISLSPNDILGHRVGPESEQIRALSLEMDRQLADFFGFLGKRIGLENTWLVLSADHGIAPVFEEARDKDRIQAGRVDVPILIGKLNVAVSNRLHRPASEFVHADDYDFSHFFLSSERFLEAKVQEADAERMVGEELLKLGFAGFYTKSQLQEGKVVQDDYGQRFLHSYTPLFGWWVLGVAPSFSLPGAAGATGTSHGTSYNYDAYVPLAFYGTPFETGTYRTRCEPVDMVATLSSLLGINAPSKAVGRVLTEGLHNRSAK